MNRLRAERAASLSEILLILVAILVAAVGLMAMVANTLARRAREAALALDGHQPPPSAGGGSRPGVPATGPAIPARSAPGEKGAPPEDPLHVSPLLGDDGLAGIDDEGEESGAIAPREVRRRTVEMQRDLLGGLAVRRKRLAEKEEIKRKEAERRRAKANEHRERAAALRQKGGEANERSARPAEAAARLWEEKAEKADAEAARAREEAAKLAEEESIRAQARQPGESPVAPSDDPAARARQAAEARKHRSRAEALRGELARLQEGLTALQQREEDAAEKLAADSDLWERLTAEVAQAGGRERAHKDLRAKWGDAVVERNAALVNLNTVRGWLRTQLQRIAGKNADLHAAELAAEAAEQAAQPPAPVTTSAPSTDRERLQRARQEEEEEKRRWEYSRVLREEPIDLVRTLAEGGSNPGAYVRLDGTTSQLSLAPHLLVVNDGPWVPLWARDQWEFQQRILVHELAHSLHTNPKNQHEVERFLALRWKKNEARFKELNAAWKATRDKWRKIFEIQRESEVPESAVGEWEQFTRRKRLIAELPEEERAHEEALLKRDLEIATARLAGAEVEDRAKRDRIDLPSRFPGDAHGLANEKEYFAVAVELFFHDPKQFRERYSAAEQEALKHMFDGRRGEHDSPDDLEAWGK